MAYESFNDSWTVRPKASIFAQLSGRTDGAVPVTLPHDAMITQERAPEHGAGRAYFPGGCFEYSKTFDAPEEWRTKRVSVEFGGVYRDAVVFVNNAAAGQRPYGYSPFVVELDPFLRYGESNTIRVEARAHDDSRWYTGVGIYRNTRLIVTDLVHLAWRGLRVTTPDVDSERAVVETAVDVRNDSLGTEPVAVEVDIVDGSGTVVARGSATVTTRAGHAAVARIRTYLSKPRLWSVDQPDLYTACVRLRSADAVVDERHTTFGVRTLRLDPDHGLRINGETVKLRGACVHHDNGILGAAAIDRAEERKIELLKAAGFNAIRSAHNPVSPTMLDACDRVGMLVIDEAFDIWTESKSSFDHSVAFPEWWERDLEAMVLKDINHPSVISYSIGNEVPETGHPLGSEWGRRLAEKVRSLDPTRFVTNGINGVVSTIDAVAAEFSQVADDKGNGGVNAMMSSLRDLQNNIAKSSMVTERTAESFGVLDIAGMNYGDARYTLDRELFPNRIIVGTETFPPAIADNWALILDSPHVIGDFTWTGFDYLGEVGIGRARYADTPPAFAAPYPWIAAWCGDLDITGYRRPQSYYRELVFGLRTEPYLAVQRPETYHRNPADRTGWSWSDSIASWTWPVDPGTPIRVEVYTAPGDDEVELALGGETLERKPVGADLPLVTIFETAYHPGELSAVAYRNGRETGRTTLRSANGTTTLAASADRYELVADDTDLAFVSIELRDPAGTLVTSADRKVAVSVEGVGILQALGSARPDNAERYDAGEHTTFDGRALAVVRPTGVGAIAVSVTASGLEPVVLSLSARRSGLAG